MLDCCTNGNIIVDR